MQSSILDRLNRHYILKQSPMLVKSMQEQYTTDMYEGMLAETVAVHGNNGDVVNAYFARPLGGGPFPGIV